MPDRHRVVCSRWSTLACVLPMFAPPGAARAQTVSVSGALGAGTFGTQPAAAVDLGLDVSGHDWAVGAGGRARWIADSGFRAKDWDEASELATLIRYALYRRQPERGLAVSAAAGALIDASIGRGAIVDRYSTGIDIDHRHLGVQLRARGADGGGELMVDDVVSPRVAAARGSVALVGPLELGATGALDVDAPAMDGRATQTVALFGVDVAVVGAIDGARGAGYTELVAAVGLGAGIHVGVTGDAPIGEREIRIGGRVEGRTGTAGYVPGWFGPLHELEREVRIDRAGAGGLGGLGGVAELSADDPELGSVRAGYAIRRGLPDSITLRALAPHAEAVQLGGWLAAAIGSGDPDALAAAAEARVRVSGAVFVGGELARMYRREEGILRPLWIASAWLGAVVGE